MARWREEDLQQQHLDNALALWNRFLSNTRTEVVPPTLNHRFLLCYFDSHHPSLHRLHYPGDALTC